MVGVKLSYLEFVLHHCHCAQQSILNKIFCGNFTAQGHNDLVLNCVKVQRNKEGGMSPLQIYQRLTRLRRERSFSSGRLQFSIVNDNVISFMRFSKDGAPYLVALNLGNSVTTDDYTLSAGVSYGKVVLYVSQLESSLSTVREGSKLNLAQLTLAPGEGVVAILMFDVL